MHRSTPHPPVRSAPRVLFALALTMGLLESLTFAPTARAATIMVTTTIDEFGTGTACALREAIQAANTDITFGGCAAGSGADTITLSAGTYTLTRAGELEDANATGDLDITQSLTLNGANQAATTIDGNAQDQVVHTVAGVTVNLNSLTIRNGATSELPGCGGILNAGTLSFHNSTITHNNGMYCGGIDNYGTVTLVTSTVSNNNGSFSTASGINNNRGASLMLTNSFVLSNGAAADTATGGINNAGTLTVTGSTISGNQGAHATSGISNSGSLTITSSSISNGAAAGGAISNDTTGTATIRQSTITGNQAYFTGAGIGNSGTLAVTDSTIANNGGSVGNPEGELAGAGGSGLTNSGTATLTNTTISNNQLWTATDGSQVAGAIFNNKPMNASTGGVLTLINSTISGNVAGAHYSAKITGGIMNVNGGTVTLANSTIHDNRTDMTQGTPDARASVYNLGGIITLRNTILAKRATPSAAECGGTLTSQGYNLIQSVANCTITGTTTGNKLNVDPKLGPLADNGGPTLTHALLVGSPAIDAANPGIPGSGTACTTKDQRSVVRPQDGNADGTSRCDMGAIERERATIASDAFSRTTTNGWGSATTGGAYTVTRTAANYSVGNGAGMQRLATAGSGTATWLPQAQVLNADLRARVATDKLAAGAGQYAYLVLRNVGPDTEYRAQLRLEVGGTVQARLIRTVTNQETTLGAITTVPGVTHKANTFVRVRAQVVGSSPATVRIKVWADGQTEPTAWLVTGTDTTPALQAPGMMGLRAYLGPKATTAPVRVTFDDLQVTSVQP